MNDSDFNKLMARFETIRAEVNTPEQATALLQSEGIVDENGRAAAHLRDAGVTNTICQ